MKKRSNEKSFDVIIIIDKKEKTIKKIFLLEKYSYIIIYQYHYL